MICKNNRKARTRTLIQIGGLVAHSGLTHLVSIQMGEDLQKNPKACDKAATLLGLFLQMVDSFQVDLDPKTRGFFSKLRGLSSLRFKKESRPPHLIENVPV